MRVKRTPLRNETNFSGLRVEFQPLRPDAGQRVHGHYEATSTTNGTMLGTVTCGWAPDKTGQCAWELVKDTVFRNEDAQRGMPGDAVDWLGEACSSLGQRAEPTFSAPRAGLCYYLH